MSVFYFISDLFCEMFCQLTVSTLDGVKNSGSSFFKDNSEQTSEIPAVHIDTECVSITQQVNTPPSQTNEDMFLAEKARIENEMDPSDISNVSAANLVRTIYQNLNKYIKEA